MKKMKFAVLFALLAGLLVSACQPVPPVVTPPEEGDYTYGEDAAVESLQVLLLETFPLGAQAVVTGFLPDGCTELVEVNVEQEDQEFILTLVTRRPTGDIACTMALVPFEESVNLEIQGLEAGTYTVTAQDQQAQFTLDVDNVFLQPEAVIGGNDIAFTKDAVVEDLSVAIMESYPVQVSVQLSGYLPDGCTEIHDVSASMDGDTFTIQIITKRPGGDVACTMAIVPFEERISLEVEGLPAGDYIVRYGELSETFTLEMDN